MKKFALILLFVACTAAVANPPENGPPGQVRNTTSTAYANTYSNSTAEANAVGTATANNAATINGGNTNSSAGNISNSVRTGDNTQAVNTNVKTGDTTVNTATSVGPTNVKTGDTTVNAATSVGPTNVKTGDTVVGPTNVSIGCTSNCGTDSEERIAADKSIAKGHDDALKEAANSKIRNTPSMLSPALVSSNDTCMGSTSGSVAAPGLGIGFGTTWVDENCKMLKNSQALWNMGFRSASVALLCNDEKIRVALESTGYPCPVKPVVKTEVKPYE